MSDAQNMSQPESTCWTVVMAAGAGDPGARAQFTDTYLDVVRAYLASRWHDRPAFRILDDAVQEVFLECFRARGALDGLDRSGTAAFRTFLYAVVRNVALRCEERLRRGRETPLDDSSQARLAETDDPTPSVAFDRAWARALLGRARARQRAGAADADAKKRIELLDLRFGEGIGIKDIAARWDMPAERVHSMYRRARSDFKSALLAELAFHGPGDDASVERESQRLLAAFGSD